jgi:hypothetical protein
MPLKLLMRPSGILVPTAELGLEQLPERQLILGDDIPYGLVLSMAHDGLTPRLLQVDANRNLKVTLASQSTPGTVRIQDFGGGPIASVVAVGTNGLAGGNGLVVVPSLQDNAGNGVAAWRAAAVTLASLSSAGAAVSTPPGQWAASNNPGAGVAASASRAAGGVGVRHVATGGIIILSATTALAGITTVTFNFRDGATGAGAILFAVQVTLPAAVIPVTAIAIPPINIPGSANTAMTLEGSAAVGNLLESVSLFGYDTT